MPVSSEVRWALSAGIFFHCETACGVILCPWEERRMASFLAPPASRLARAAVARSIFMKVTKAYFSQIRKLKIFE
jgi:hypothetical protein